MPSTPVLLALAGLTYFGNMSLPSGTGLTNIFDTSEASLGYNSAASGWAGVTLASPKNIIKIVLVSNNNGFDGSGAEGSTSQITLKAACATGSTPSSFGSATLLGTIGPFNDINSVTEKTLTLSSAVSCQHVLVEVSSTYSGSWAALRQVRIYEEGEADPVAYHTIGSSPVFVNKFVPEDVHIYPAWTPLPSLSDIFEITQTTTVQINGIIGLSHKCNYYLLNTSIPAWIGWGLRGGIRSGVSAEAVSVSTSPGVNAPNWIKGAKNANNLSCEQHYASGGLVGQIVLEPGFYRFEVWSLWHGASNGNPVGSSDTALKVNGDGGPDDPYNTLLLSFFPE